MRASDTEELEQFGAGAYGHWSWETGGMPCYTPRHREAPHVYHLIGNDRLTATCHATGYVQVYDWSRGFRCLNRTVSAEEPCGGFVRLALGDDCVYTLGAELTSVHFGAHYFEKTTSWQGLTIHERIEAPPGDDPVLLHTVTVTNTGEAPADARLSACWSVNNHPIIAIPVLPKRFMKLAARWRARFMRRFEKTVVWDAENACRCLHYTPPRNAPPPEKRTHRDWHPGPVFLAALDGNAEPMEPERCATGSPLWLEAGSSLAPGETRTLRFLFGTAPREAIAPLVNHWRKSEPGKRPIFDFTGEGIPEWLTREAAWHATYLQSAVCFMDYFDAHTVDQGSAYSYLQGGTGAPRDVALFILPMVYLRPDLAKDMLRFLLRSQRAQDGGFPYAFLGHGITSGAGAHSRSSDLDLFVFWALSEYLNATRDYAFLDETEPYYPKDAHKADTVLGHVRTSFRHLTESIGIGPHGLLRCGTGDWNDVLCGFSVLPPITALRGESTLNAGMATFVLPAIAGAVESRDAGLAQKMRDLATQQAQALEKQWTGRWVARGYLGYFGRRLGIDRLFLDTQPFGVLGGVWTGERRKRLFENIQHRCVAPMRAGARCLDRPYRAMHLKPGVDTNGGDWAAIDSWLAWAWSREDPRAAWDFFLSTTMAARAETYPDNWYGIWSGPDAFNGCDHPRPAETSNFVFTPMAEFPMFNMNRHSGPLLDVIKLAGIQPTPEGITIDPRLPEQDFALVFPWISVSYHEGCAIGVYIPRVHTRVQFAIRPPREAGTDLEVRVNTKRVPFTINEAGLAVFGTDIESGLCWEIVKAGTVPPWRQESSAACPLTGQQPSSREMPG